MTLKNKKLLLVRLIEYYVSIGNDITPLVGKSLMYFDFDAIQKTLNEIPV